ncbi:PilZ domain-containing protein [Silvimonas iriomotensis]|uniref:PilZ domain-containing protein n=1 Tax=Silvimonas iriomotensis TaxID=449662 RepID=A0ABQ2PDN1_9NEIS|nr:PilZ domain-containing protein [Silvimonas iriomotensis]GGP23436.1 hypothetical protein GCM10010970_34360 [Silvimonas iriomotensis]
MDSVLAYARDPNLDSNQKRIVRLPVRWRAALVGGNLTRHGRSVNIAAGGMAMHCEHNLPVGWTGNLFLEVPPQTTIAEGGVVQFLQLQVRVIYAVHDGASRSFRLGLQFIDTDKTAENHLVDELVKRYPSQARALR